MSLNTIYDWSPVWIQNLMCSIKGWTIKRRRYNEQFFYELNAFESGRYNSAEELSTFLENVKNVSFYKDTFKANYDKKGV